MDGVRGDDFLVHRKRHDAAEQASGPRRRASTPFDDCFASQFVGLDHLGGLTRRNVFDELANIPAPDLRNPLAAQERLDVPVDAASVDLER